MVSGVGCLGAGLTGLFVAVPSSGSLVGQLLRTSTSALASRLTTTVLTVLVTPLLVLSYGGAGYGLIALALSGGSYLAVLDQGLAAGVRTLVSRTVEANGTNLTAQRIVRQGRLGLACLGLPLAASSGVIGWLWGAGGSPLGTLLLFYLCPAFAILPGVVYLRGLEGLGAAHIVQRLGMLSGVFSVVSAASLALGGAPVETVITVFALGPLPSYLVARRLFLRRSGSAPQCRHAGMPDVSEIWKLSWPMMLIQFNLAMAYGIDPLIVHWHFGLDANATFGLASRLAAGAALALTAVWPVLAARYAGNSPSRSELRRTTLVFGTISLVLNGVLLALGPAAFSLLGAGRVVFDWELMFAMCLLNVATALQLPASAGLSVNRKGLRTQLATTTVMASVNVSLTLQLTPKFGLATPVWVSASCLLILHAVPIYLSARRRSVNWCSVPGR